MKHALVFGASGGMGYSIVQELVQRGIKVTAFARSEEKLKSLFAHHPDVTIQTGDIFRIEDLKAAATHVDVIFQSANIPYEQWHDRLIPFYKNIMKLAELKKAKLVFVENIYAYGRATGKKVTEDTVKNPHTKKGKLRLQGEELIKKANVPAIIAHFPDFYGPNAENTLLHYTFQNVVQNKKASFVGKKTIAREYIYTPDGAKALVNLAMNDHAYGQNWNIPGYGVITGEEIAKILRELTGYNRSISTVRKGMIRFLGLFNRTMREMVEMFYLNEDPVVLDGVKYEREIGELPRTPYREGIGRTIEFMKQIRASKL